QRASPFDPEPSQVLPKRAADLLPEEAAKVEFAEPYLAGNLGQGEWLREVRLDEGTGTDDRQMSGAGLVRFCPGRFPGPPVRAGGDRPGPPEMGHYRASKLSAVARLSQVIPGTGPERLDRKLLRATLRHQDDGKPRPPPSGDVKKLEAGDVRERMVYQHYIEKVADALLQDEKRSFPAGCLDNAGNAVQHLAQVD